MKKLVTLSNPKQLAEKKIKKKMANFIDYNKELNFEYGVTQRLSPLVRRVIAPNPSAFTLHGTGTYIVGNDSVAIIDPGPELPEHTQAILNAVKGEKITHVLVTHTHLDHSPGTVHIKAASGALSYAYGPHARNIKKGEIEEGADFDFAPDKQLIDGEVIKGSNWTIESIHTPGHTSNHMCFALKEENALFPGDHVMGWSTTIVSPPDGDMSAYMTSLDKLTHRQESIYYPTHGAPITSPKPYVKSLLAHRYEREDEIMVCLKDGVDNIPDIVEKIYAKIDSNLHKAAARSVLSHLIHMIQTGRVKCEGIPTPNNKYTAVN